MNSAKHIWLILNDSLHTEPPVTLEDRSNCSVRHLKCLDDLGNGSIWIKILHLRFLHRKVILRYGTYKHIVLLRILYKPDRHLPADCYREDSTRKKYRIPQGKYRNHVRQLRQLHLRHPVALHNRNDTHLCSCRRQ